MSKNGNFQASPAYFSSHNTASSGQLYSMNLPIHGRISPNQALRRTQLVAGTFTLDRFALTSPRHNSICARPDPAGAHRPASANCTFHLSVSVVLSPQNNCTRSTPPTHDSFTSQLHSVRIVVHLSL